MKTVSIVTGIFTIALVTLFTTGYPVTGDSYFAAGKACCTDTRSNVAGTADSWFKTGSRTAVEKAAPKAECTYYKKDAAATAAQTGCKGSTNRGTSKVAAGNTYDYEKIKTSLVDDSGCTNSSSTAKVQTTAPEATVVDGSDI